MPYTLCPCAIITCAVCCEEKLLTDDIHKIVEKGAFIGSWNVAVPGPGCLPYLAS